MEKSTERRKKYEEKLREKHKHLFRAGDNKYIAAVSREEDENYPRKQFLYKGLNIWDMKSDKTFFDNDIDAYMKNIYCDEVEITFLHEANKNELYVINPNKFIIIDKILGVKSIKHKGTGDSLDGVNIQVEYNSLFDAMYGMGEMSYELISKMVAGDCDIPKKIKYRLKRDDWRIDPIPYLTKKIDILGGTNTKLRIWGYTELTGISEEEARKNKR